MWNSKRLVLAHLWFAFAGFGAALLLGEWQMFVRSPLYDAAVGPVPVFRENSQTPKQALFLASQGSAFRLKRQQIVAT